jgi:hypothetical protein
MNLVSRLRFGVCVLTAVFSLARLHDHAQHLVIWRTALQETNWDGEHQLYKTKAINMCTYESVHSPGSSVLFPRRAP